MASQKALVWSGTTGAAIVAVAGIAYFVMGAPFPGATLGSVVAPKAGAPAAPSKSTSEPESTLVGKLEAVAPAAAPQSEAKPPKSPPETPKAELPKTESPKAEAPKAESPKAEAPSPAFDVVRVEKSGEAVIAGRASANAEVELQDRGVKIAEAKADASGQFVIVPNPLPAGDHSLVLVARGGQSDVKLSDAVAVNVPSGDAKAKPAAAKPPAPTQVAKAELPKPDAKSPTPKPATESPAPQTAKPAQPAADLNAAASPTPAKSEAASAAKPETAPAKTVVAAAAPNEPAAGKSVAGEAPQPEAQIAKPAITAALAPATKPEAKTQAGEAAARVAIVSVDAAGDGRLVVQGLADAGKIVRLYLNGAYVADAVANAEGHWSLTVEHGMNPGAYAVRADEINGANAAVIARAEAPFAYPAPPEAKTPAPQATASALPAAGRPADAPKLAAPQAEAPARQAQAAAPQVAVAAPEPPPAAQAGASQPLQQATAKAGPTPQAAPDEGASKPAESTTPEMAKSGEPTTDEPKSDVVVDTVKTATVVRGDTLWGISQGFYGEGLRYHEVFAENKNQIRNPNLIYPGQVFVLPKLDLEPRKN